MEDLCDMMGDPEVDALECENEYDNHMDDTFFEETMSSQSLGMALGLAEMMAEENNLVSDPADLFDDFQDSRERISLKDRHQKSDVPVPAFEQHVYKKCGIL